MRLALLTALAWCSLPPMHAAGAASSVRLFAGDKPVALRENDQSQIQQQIITLVESSNFHSGRGDKYHIFTATGVQQDYRDTVAGGEYVLLLLSPAKKIVTVGGEITAAEVVIGMRGPTGKNTVFTIDETGAVVSHGKYSGVVYLELKKTIGAARE
jgi:hypothetical protein